MICVEYAILQREYDRAFKLYNSIITEKEQLFMITQPSAIEYDKDKVQTTPKNPLETYIEQKEAKRIDQRLEEAKTLLYDRDYLLKAKKRELVASKVLDDLIFRYKNIDGIKVSHIAEMLGFSTSQVYRILHQIDKKIKLATKCDKMRIDMC